MNDARQSEPDAADGSWRIGVDIGGTFTDVVILNETTGQLIIGKVLTTSSEPSRAVVSALRSLLSQHGIHGSELQYCMHATTLITNALIERKGAKTGLLTTRGFKDILEIGREVRYDLYDLRITTPEPLVPRERRREVRERTGADGRELEPLDLDELRREVKHLVDEAVETVAIVFLHSYRNTAHEALAEDAIRAANPRLLVSCSSQVAREMREFERTSTTVANAYVRPLAAQYVNRLATELRDDIGMRGKLALMQSAGGLTSSESAAKSPINLVESGPAAGALAGAFFSGLAGEETALAFDMGGTTAKLCIIAKGEPTIAHSFEVGRVHRFKKGSGLPLAIPTVDLIEIGAGGGSIARVNDLGLLQVGPDSAGARPGPACYGLGGTEPTVTDADLVLGFVRPDHFLGGEMQLNADAARASIGQLGAALGKTVDDTAAGIHQVVIENMAAAARVHIAERGYDPRHFVLVATGGAGPVHAYELARSLRLRRILCPFASGVASTLGLLAASHRVDLVEAYVAPLTAVNWGTVNRIFERMKMEAQKLLAGVGSPAASVQFRLSADLRYVGQGFDVQAELPSGPYSAASVADITSRFETTYRRLYGRTVSRQEVEAVNWRLTAFSTGAKDATIATALQAGLGRAPQQQSLIGHRPVYFPEASGRLTANVYDRYILRPGDRFGGPAIIEEAESTVVVGPAADCHVDDHLTIVIDLNVAAVATYKAAVATYKTADPGVVLATDGG